MKYERFSVHTCCGSMGVAFKLGDILSVDLITLLVDAGFIEQKSFTKAGILYVENETLIATGAFNTNILQIKCKKANCISAINLLEELLITVE